MKITKSLIIELDTKEIELLKLICKLITEGNSVKLMLPEEKDNAIKAFCENLESKL